MAFRLKKGFGAFSAAAVIVFGGAFRAAAEDSVSYGGLKYYTSEYDNNAEGGYYDGVSAKVEIPVSFTVGGKTYYVAEVDVSEQFKNSEALVEFTCAPEASTTGDFCFENCPNLAHVSIPGSEINQRQYFDCPKINLAEIITPGIRKIGEYAFGLSEPTIYASFDNISMAEIEYCASSAMSNRFYTNVHVSDQVAFEALSFDETETLTVENVDLVADYSRDFSKLKKAVCKNSSTITLDSQFAVLSELVIKGESEFVNIYDIPVLATLDLTGAGKIGTLSLSSLPLISSLNLGNTTFALYLTQIPGIKEISGTDNVTEIQVRECDKLTTLELPGIEYMGRDCISYCPELTEVYLGATLSELHTDGIFTGCKKVENLIYGGSLEQWINIKRVIDENDSPQSILARVPAFWYGGGNNKVNKLTTLTSANVGSAEAITRGAFAGYKGLTLVDLPSSVKKICSAAFASCTNLTDVKMDVERIEQFAFLGSAAIKSLTLGPRLKYIGPSFGGKFSPELVVNFLGTGEQWAYVTLSNTAYEDCDDPDSEYGFAYAGTPNLMQYAKEFLFNGEQLEELVLDNPVKIYKSFYGNKTLKSIVINCGTQFPEIESEAFMLCTGLKSVKYTAPVGSRSGDVDHSKGFVIGYRAFTICSNLEEIEILDNIKSIEAGALEGTKWIKKQPQQEMLYFETEKGLTAYVFVGNAAENTHVNIKEGTVAITAGALGAGGSTSDGYDYSGVSSVSLPSTLCYIGEDAFSQCQFKGEFTVPASVEVMRSNRFGGELDRFVIADSETTLKSDGHADIYCSSVKDVYIGRNSEVFIKANYGVGSITFGKNVTEVNDRFNLPSSIADIYALSTNPPTAVLSQTEWGNDYYPAFKNYDFDTVVLHVPAGCTEVYKAADGWNQFKNIVDDAQSGIESVETESPAAIQADARHYDVSGRAIAPDARGLHIIVNPDGSRLKRAY